MKRVEFKNRRGERLVGVLHGEPDGVAVISCHGMLSGKDGRKHVRLAEVLSKRGLCVLRFDFAGRGESEGSLEQLTYSRQVEDLDAAIDFLQRQGVTRVGLFGSSMGGAVALLAAARDERVVAIATLAAVGHPGAIEERYPERYELWRSQGYLDTEHGRIGRDFLDDAEQHDVCGALRVVSAPVLVIHGTDDDVVPCSDAIDIASAARNASLELVEGAGHRFDDELSLRPAIAQVAAFLTSHLSKDEE